MFKCNSSIVLEDIKSKVTDIEILSFYFNINKVPTLISSPLRQDKKPSLGFYTIDGKTILYTDFSTLEKGNIFTLLSKYWKCSYKNTLLKIYKDIPNIKKIYANTSMSNSCIAKNVVIKKKSTNLKCKIREWQTYDIEYWKEYGISLEWLKYAGIYPISHFFLIKEDKEYVFKADKLAYIYTENKENNFQIKLYQPLNKNNFKWLSKFDKSVISLWTKIPKTNDILCICSSVKDALCLWSNTGIPCIAPQGEGYSLSETAIKELKNRFKKIYILYDNDKAGIEDAIKLSKITGFTNIVLPQFKGGKDVSDLYKVLKNKEQFKQTLLNLFK